MVDLMTWRIALRSPGVTLGPGLPAAVVTAEPRFRHERMPAEIGLLLPTNEGPKQLIDAVVADPARCGDAILGLFMANPFLNISLEGPRLTGAGVRWVANLPSVEQQDEDFSKHLADVALDRERELDCLSRFRAQGFRIAVVVADGPGAVAAAAIEPDTMIILPRVADFAAAFPSLRQRGAAAQAVYEATRANGWHGPILGLGKAREAQHQGLWPERLDGLLCRPIRVSHEMS